MAVFFMVALTSTLVSLPFASRQNRTVILNTVEEEAGSTTNTFNEEHKSGKSLHGHFFDFDSFMQLNRVAVKYDVPRSVNILSSSHSRRIIQPPEC
jgi:hypothetical protein